MDTVNEVQEILKAHRALKPSPLLKKIDDVFGEKYVAVSAGHKLEVLRCYSL